MLIGVIGQGFVGKNIADDFEKRGHTVLRYSKEEPYINNKDAIKDADIVFIAVPTPTTPEGFDASIVDSVLGLVGPGKTAVIKSTVLPGTTEALQKKHAGITVLHSPEFLREKRAAEDVAKPSRNIVGIPIDTSEYRMKADAVHKVLPEAPYTATMLAKESELVKYVANCFLYTKVVFANLAYETAEALGADWEKVKAGVVADPRIGPSHFTVTDGGRGAGGHCFIKDFAAFSRLYEEMADDQEGVALLKAFEAKNNRLLAESGKDLNLLQGVYGFLKQ
jgi:UDPglucose 6-dehydrogenase